MSSEPSKSHASAWAPLAAVPLLYLLTMPGVIAMSVPVGGSPPKWLEYYVVPCQWLFKSTAFGTAYEPYFEWMWKTVLKRSDHV